jgi:hypothetical protein
MNYLTHCRVKSSAGVLSSPVPFLLRKYFVQILNYPRNDVSDAFPVSRRCRFLIGGAMLRTKEVSIDDFE